MSWHQKAAVYFRNIANFASDSMKNVDKILKNLFHFKIENAVKYVLA